jgi:hypothetical protein
MMAVLKGNFKELDYYRYFQINKSLGNGVSSTLKLDVIIPVKEADIDVLGPAIDGIRENLRHPIGRILIVASNLPRIREISRAKHCEFVCEDAVLPIAKESIDYHVNGSDRSGWLFQQFLKLSGDLLSSSDYFLAIDADTVLVQPQVFQVDGKIVLLHSDEHHPPYFDVCKKLLGLSAATNLSFVSHQMLFERARLIELKGLIEKQHGESWHKVILKLMDRSQESAFSEYELYGQWILRNYGKDIIREYWFNIALGRSRLASLDKLMRELGTRFRSASFHSHLK